MTPVVLPGANPKARLVAAFVVVCAHVAVLCDAARAAGVAGNTWMMAPVGLDDDIDPQVLEAVGDAMRDAWQAGSESALVFGDAALLASSAQPQRTGPALDRPMALLDRGEERYMAFEFAAAAAALAEAAGLLTANLGRLDGDALDELARARALEGVAWLEAGNGGAALDAFSKLISVWPEYQPDPTVLPPTARKLLERARLRVRGRGLGRIEVTSEPPGATVWIDGQLRGRAPISVDNLPVGVHSLCVGAPGRLLHEETVNLTRAGLSRTVKLQVGSPGLAVARIISGVRSSASIGSMRADLESVAAAWRLEAIILLAVARRAGQRLMLSAVKWDGTRVAGVVHAQLGPDIRASVADAVRGLRGRSWPPVQLPPDAAPLDVDFERAAIGVGPTWGRLERRGAVAALSSWWFWTGAVAVLGGAAAVYLSVRGDPPATREPDRVLFTVVPRP